MHPSRSVLRSTARLSTFLLFLVVVGAFAEVGRAPWLVLSLGGFLLLLGVLGMVYVNRNMAKYKTVFDYEPTEFQGKPSNGADVRSFLIAVNTLSLWCVIAALIMLGIVWIHFG